MRLNKLILFISAASLILTGKVSALGLGEITLKSALNEPLDAEIRLLQIRDLTEQEILVGLASNADFDRVGVEKSFFLSGMAFSVDLDAPNGPVVKIKTNSPVREPFLNFLVESQWPSGRILREYTLLMDLPTFSAQEASSVQAPKPVAEPPPAQATATPASPPPATVRTRPVAPQTSTSYASDSYGPVSANDNLWNIALKVRPSKEYSVQQTMIAIQRLNPDAFINDNINLLKRGQVLRIPDGDQIRELNFNQAVSEVAFQNDQWDSKSATKATLVADNEAPSLPVQDAGGGRITLGVGNDDTVKDTQSGTGSDTSDDTQTLQNDLGNTLEQLDTANRENTELRSRITELQAQIETMERLVEVSSAELRALQLASEQQTADAEATELESETDSSSVDETEAIAEAAEATADSDANISEAVGSEIEDAIGDVTDSVGTGLEEVSSESNDNVDADTTTIASDTAELVAATSDAVNTPTQETEADPAQSSEATVVKPDARTVVTTGANNEPGLLDTIMDNIVLIAAVLIAVLVAAFALLRKVFGNKDDDLEDTFNPFEEDPILEDEELDNQLGDEFEDHSATISEDFELDIDQPDSDNTVEEGETAIVPADVIAETDIYIAYGKFDQAEEMLEKAIAVEPENNAARLKLLEVHAGANNLEGFDKTLSELYQSEDQTAIDRGNELRTGFKNIAPFALAGAAGVAVSQVVQSLQSDDDETHKDLSQEFAELDSLDSADSLDDEVIEDFDFDLDPEFDLGDETTDLITEDTGEPVSSDAETKLNLADEFSSLSEADPAEEISPDLSDSVSQLKSTSESSLDETDVTIQRKLSDLELEAIGDSNDSGGAPESLLTPGLDLVSDSIDVDDASLDHSMADMNPASNDDFEPSLDLDELSLESIDNITTQPNLDNVLNLNDVAPDFADELVSLEDIDIDDGLASTVDSVTTQDEDTLTNNVAEATESSGIDISEGDSLNQNNDLQEVSDAAFDLDDGLDLSLEQPDFDEAGLDAIDGELKAAGNTYDNLESNADFISDSDLELDIADLDLDPEALSNDSELNSLFSQDIGDNEFELNAGEELEIDGDEIANIGAFQPGQSDMPDIDSGIETETDLLQDADLDALDEEMDALAADVGLDQLTNSAVAINEAEIEEDESYNSEEVFAEVLASTEQNLDDIETDEGLNDDFDEGMDFLADTDESDTKLDLARAYIDMGDGDGARDILNEVLSDGNDEQKEEAQTLIEKIPS